MHGAIRITSLSNGWERSSAWYDNQVVDAGLAAIADALENGTAIQIDSGEIGTGSTAVTAGDTDLETPSVTGITVESTSRSGAVVTYSFYLTDAQLADGTYREFGLRIGSTLFSRVLFDIPYTKASGTDTRIDYVVTASAVI